MIQQVANTFPQRTAALVRTVEEIELKRQMKQITGKVFLIGGRNHFEQESLDPRYSLLPLYQLLDKLPAIVVHAKILDQPKADWEITYNS